MKLVLQGGYWLVALSKQPVMLILAETEIFYIYISAHSDCITLTNVYSNFWTLLV